MLWRFTGAHTIGISHCTSFTMGISFVMQTRNVTRLVASAIVAGLGALTHTLGSIVPVIGASGFLIAATAIGTVVGSFR
ncbi:hypothetical protein ACSBR2_015609 [Camellia fascicularis]